ncbi:uncharacterized protein [Dermacentor albipictus]|uniref:uncharacterized protein n=1 Tax=Dermacentor albipictus TaxID=60249 RepID=UPI0038FD2F66
MAHLPPFGTSQAFLASFLLWSALASDDLADRSKYAAPPDEPAGRHFPDYCLLNPSELPCPIYCASTSSTVTSTLGAYLNSRPFDTIFSGRGSGNSIMAHLPPFGTSALDKNMDDCQAIAAPTTSWRVPASQENNSTRFILSNYNRTASISAMKSSLNLPSLLSRRKLFRLCLFHKLFHHPLLRNKLISPPPYVSPRLDHIHKLDISFCRSNAFLQSFVPRTSNEWNHLPASIATIADHQLFKNVIANTV